jgi:hypothetical protein
MFRTHFRGVTGPPQRLGHEVQDVEQVRPGSAGNMGAPAVGAVKGRDQNELRPVRPCDVGDDVVRDA